jgi:serine/threonine protein phosphatase PrpC
MDYFGITDRGKIRKDNQDCFLIEPHDEGEQLVVALCDGMGGAKAGGIASDVASKSFVAYVGERLSDRGAKALTLRHVLIGACSEANGVVYQYSCFDSNYSGMGTTLVGGIISDGEACISNVGDSRAYQISKKKISQITRDHSLVEDMVERGEITREAARNHPRKNIITNALGLESGLTADVFDVKLSKGDYLLFCSDGLSNIIYDEEMLEAAKKSASPEELCRFLIKLALERNSPDNVTVVAVRA